MKTKKNFMNKQFSYKVVVRLFCFFLCFFLFNRVVHAQVNVTPNQSANALSQKLVGNGVQVFNATLNCPGNANGIFTVVTSNLGLDSGIVLTSGQAATVGTTQGVNGPNTGSGPSMSNGVNGDADLNTVLAGITTEDACVLEFDFLPAGDTVKFDYLFASTEYQGFSCTNFNDVFGFFISGPGITGSNNIAKIPGTNIPICVNSTTGVPAVPGPMCTNMGPGSPFSMYYINNMGGATITYGGFTHIFTAISAVTPCSTYHLKLAIADGTDHILDSGVFLKAGSLTSNAVTVTPIGGGGLSSPQPYCVRGCLPGQFVFNRPVANPNPLTIHYQIAGTAVNGTDYSTILDSVVIPPGLLSTTLNINGLLVNPATGVKTVKLLILNPYSCSVASIIDSAELQIYDSFLVNITNNDTTVCRYTPIHMNVIGDTLLSFSWTPVQWIDSPLVRNPTMSPGATTTYTVAATIPGSGCAPAHDHVTITIKQEPVVSIGPDITTCLGIPIHFTPTVTPTNQNYSYSWSPGTYLNSSTIKNPTSNPTADITYVLTADPGAGTGCKGYDTIHIHVLPNDIKLYNHDTAICKGATVQVHAVGDPAFTYRWQPQKWVSDTTILLAALTPDTSIVYTVTASFLGCPNIVKSLVIDVQPNPQVYIGVDREKCQWDTLHFDPVVAPSTYPFYTYSWTPTTGINFPNKPNIVFSGQTNVTPLTLTVTTPAGCKGNDKANITVHKGNFASVVPADTGICPRDSVHLKVTGGKYYDWTPGYFLLDSTIGSNVAFPVTTVLYSLLVKDQWNCYDTVTAHIVVHPDAVLDLGDNITLYPGDSTVMQPTGNALYYQWFPPLGLNATNIANPIATPNVNTRYFALGTTEWGCSVLDSVDVNVVYETLLDVPNAFNPGSGPNGEIKIIKKGIATLENFSIFNRWGQVVFETTNIDDGWNGQYNGAPQPMGVYIYTVKAVTNTGRKFVKQGNITLIR
jgi:gliding motility-associated-like protein